MTIVSPRWIFTLFVTLAMVACAPGRLGPGLDPEFDGANIHFAFGPDCDERLIVRAYYVVCHAAQWRIPKWVVYHLDGQSLRGSAKRSEGFRPDPLLPAEERAELSDYRRSGYSRGHMAPAADFKRSEEAMEDTFLLSNMAPQLQSLNGGRWRVLEDEVRDLTARGELWVVTGAVFLDEAMRPVKPQMFIGGRVAVPTHFFKAILCRLSTGRYEMYAFLMPHVRGLEGPTVRYAIAIDALEKYTALDFFGPLPDELEAGLEAVVADVWPPQ